MPRISKIKNHPERKSIERDIVSGKAKSTIAKRYGITLDAIEWHEKNNLITRQMITAVNKTEQGHGLDVLENLTGLIDRTEAILTKAENRNNNNQALAAIRELRGSYALISAIQLRLIELQQTSGEVSEEDNTRREAEEAFQREFQEGLEALCQEEHRVWDALHLKAATRNTARIPGILYNEEEPVVIEDIVEEIVAEETLEISEAVEEEPPMRAGVIPPPTQLTYTDKRGQTQTGEGMRRRR